MSEVNHLFTTLEINHIKKVNNTGDQPYKRVDSSFY